MATFAGTPQSYLQYVINGALAPARVTGIDPFTYAPRDDDSTMVCMAACDGNSMVAGSGVIGSVFDFAYPPRLRGFLRDSQATHLKNLWQVYQRGTAGLTTPQCTARFIQHVHPLFNPLARKNVVIFWEIINDINGGAADGATAVAHLLDYRSLVTSLGWELIILPAIPNDDGEPFDTRKAFVNDYLIAHPELSDYPMPRIDLAPELQDPTNATYFVTPGEGTGGKHLIDAGFAVVAQVVADVIGAI